MPEEDQEQIVDDGPTFEFEEEGDPQRKLTIDELYDHAGFKLASFNNSLASGVALFMFGVLVMYIQMVSQYMLCENQMTNVEVVAMKIIAILGFIIGLPLSGVISDKIGRSRTALAGAYIVFICWLLAAISVTLLFATVLCVAGGFAVLLPSAVVFAFENSSLYQHTRVALIVFGEYVLGQMFCLVLFNTLIDLLGWHWITVILSLPTTILIIFFHVTNDSPRFLSISGRHHTAYEELLMLHKANNVPMMQGRLKSMEIVDRGQCCGPCNLLNLRTTILLLILFLTCSFCYYSTSYGVFMSLLDTGFCETDKIIGHLTCDTDRKSYIVTTLLALLPDLLGLAFSLFLCEVAGRKTCLSILLAVAAAAILANSVCIQLAALTLMELGIARGFTFGALIVIFIYSLEAYTTDKRCTAFCYLLIFYATGMYLAGSLTFYLRQSTSLIFIVLGVVLLVSLIPIYFLEKLGKTDVDENIDEQQSLTASN
ncbi:hypothetical protein ACHWQZ_G014490 [Mnemiopsis leidyi]